jgi:PDZ domain
LIHQRRRRAQIPARGNGSVKSTQTLKEFASGSWLLALVFLLLIPSYTSAQKHQTLVTSSDSQLDSRRSVLRIPFEFVGNHIYLRARVNGSEPLWFLLDTGATASYLDQQRVAVLAPGNQGDSVRSASISFYGGRPINQKFSLRSFGFSAYDGHAIDGMLGYDFISQFVVEIDYAKRIVNLYDPASYQYAGTGEIFALILLEDDSGGKVPLVRASISQAGRAPIEGKFIADLAWRAAITFNTPFVEANKLLQPPQKTIQAVLGAGAMVRESKQPIGRLSSMQLGSFTIRNPVAIFFQDQQGIMTASEFDGIIGSEILLRFRVIFDYSRRQMILEPNRYFSDPYEYDMAGMLLVVEGVGYRVKQMMKDSPATAAGLKEGDLITAVNGRVLTLEELRRMFMRKGRSYRLSVKRGAEKIQTTITLRRLI